jgi:hypothetical protein
MLRNITICCGIVLLFDAVASAISKASGVAYFDFVIPQLAMYVVMGCVLQRSAGMGAPTIIPVLIAAVVEATLGWWISIAIGVGRPPTSHIGLTIFSTATVVLLNVALGALGMWIGYGLNRITRHGDGRSLSTKKSDVA